MITHKQKAELGYVDAVHYGWTALWVSAKTPADRVAVLEKAMNAPETQKFIKTNAAETMPFDAAQMKKFQAAEIARFQRPVKVSHYELR